MARTVHLGLGCLTLWGAAACGGPGSLAHFSGRTAEPVVAADQIREVGVRPRGYRLIGRLSSECTGAQRARRIEDAWLKDVGCSDALLLAALRQRAAEVGGALLVDRHCEAEPRGKRLGARTERTCSAWVARPMDAAGAAGGLEVAEPPTWPDPASLDDLEIAPGDAWRIRVTLKPVGPHQAARAPRPPHLVEETAVQQASQVPFGDIIARCQGDCARDSVRDAVRLAAARVGARGVWDVGCVSGKPGWVCTGRASVHEVDPDRFPAAQ